MPCCRSRTASRHRAACRVIVPVDPARGPSDRGDGSKSPPSFSVAQVSTTVLSPNSLSRTAGRHVDRRDWSCCGPVAVVAHPEHVGLASRPSARRSADLLDLPRACWRAGVGLARRLVLGERRAARARGVADERQRVDEGAGGWRRCGPARASPARRRGVGSVGEVVGLRPRPALEPAARRARPRPGSSSSVDGLGHPAASSCASSTTTASYSGQHRHARRSRRSRAARGW